MTGDTLTIEVKHLQRGQPEGYAPHTYESEITVTGVYLPLEGQMKEIVKGAVHHFTEEPNDGSMDAHFKPRLKRLEKLSEETVEGEGWNATRRAVWVARVEEPFCD